MFTLIFLHQTAAAGTFCLFSLFWLYFLSLHLLASLLVGLVYILKLMMQTGPTLENDYLC